MGQPIQVLITNSNSDVIFMFEKDPESIPEECNDSLSKFKDEESDAMK